MVKQDTKASRTGEDASGSQSIAAVERAIDVLLLFGRSTAQSLGVTEIAAELDMPKAAVHRILTSLRSRDLIAFEPSSRRYLLGAAAVGLGRAYLAKLDVRALAAAELSRLSAETAETATLSIRNGDQRIYVDQVLPRREVRMEVAIGSAHALHAGASSKAFLAFDSDEQITAYIGRNGLKGLTAKTITDEKRLRRDLASIRKRGYATSSGERQAGAASVAAPILDHEGIVIAVVSVSGPAERLKNELPECTAALLAATARLSARLGHAVGA
ncbi:MAG: IclR family transcriptional regulator [Jatrophihabitantaceae bacterium]